MVRGKFTTVVAVLAAALALVGGASAQAAPTQAAADGHNGASDGVAECYPVAARFVSRYNQDPAGFGCATSPEYPFPNGSYQWFANGEMVWSLDQGTNMVTSGKHYTYWDDYGAHTGIQFQFGPSDPYNYDRWLIRLDRDGANLGQWDCDAGTSCSRTTGGWTWAPVGSGHYQIRTEGCDVSWTGSTTCRQNWTTPIDLWV